MPAGRIVAPLPRVMVRDDEMRNSQEGPLPSLARVPGAKTLEQSEDSPKDPCVLRGAKQSYLIHAGETI